YGTTAEQVSFSENLGDGRIAAPLVTLPVWADSSAIVNTRAACHTACRLTPATVGADPAAIIRPQPYDPSPGLLQEPRPAPGGVGRSAAAGRRRRRLNSGDGQGRRQHDCGPRATSVSRRHRILLLRGPIGSRHGPGARGATCVADFP